MHSSGCLLSTHAFACRRPVNDRSELLIFVRPNARDNAVQLSPDPPVCLVWRSRPVRESLLPVAGMV